MSFGREFWEGVTERAERILKMRVGDVMGESMNVRYLMIHPMDGKRMWLTEHECARALDGGWPDGATALDLDTFIERPLTAAEKTRITNLSNDYSGSK